MVENTDIQPADWLPYRLRERLNLYEAACLLRRQDPERLNNAVVDEFIEHARKAHGVEAPNALLTPLHIATSIDALPETYLGGEVGGLLKLLKKAAGAATLQATFGVGELWRLVVGIGMEWPPELPTPAPTDGEPAKTPAQQDQELKRVELVKRHSACWQTIERDLKDASVNGLREAAGANRRGWWREGAALDWARARGKLIESAALPSSVYSMGRKKG
jgi:hypothetical protein